MSYTRPEVLVCLTKAVRKILIFRGKSEEAERPIPENVDPIVTYGIPSLDLTQVGPELARESDELDLPNEVYDWADDSSGTRRYRTLGEIADRVMDYLDKHGGQKKMSDLETRRTEIAERLRAAREQAGLSQGQVAALLKLQRPAVSEIEAGRRRVTAEEIAQLAEIFDVSAEWIISGTATMADPKVELAARELGKLKSGDLDMVLKLLRTMKKK